jgi:hypothetical protein
MFMGRTGDTVFELVHTIFIRSDLLTPVTDKMSHYQTYKHSVDILETEVWGKRFLINNGVAAILRSVCELITMQLSGPRFNVKVNI